MQRGTTRLDAMETRPVSTTHSHILSCCMHFLDRKGSTPTVSIMDVGCGNGELLRFLASVLPRLYPHLNFDFFGFDICDHGVQKVDYWNKTIERLEKASPNRDWKSKLFLVSENDPWPFSDASFDIVLSNQVLEHVRSPDFFFQQLRRILKPDGFSVNLFPLRHCTWGGHLQMPLVHWFRDFRLMRMWINLCVSLSFGKFKPTPAGSSAEARRHFVEKHADYVHFYTNYMTADELAAVTKRNGLKLSFGWSHRFVWQKLLQLAGRTLVGAYPVPGWLSVFGAFATRSVTSVTVELSRSRKYREEAGSSGGTRTLAGDLSLSGAQQHGMGK